MIDNQCITIEYFYENYVVKHSFYEKETQIGASLV